MANREKKNLTDRTLKALKKAAAGETYDVMDSTVPGFGVRVSETGRRTFMLVARYPGSSNPTRRAIGEYGALTLEKGRDKARDWIDLIKRGIDPKVQEERERISEHTRQANTFAAVAEDFIREKLPSERKGFEVERDIRRELIPAWGERPITDITPLDVLGVIKKVKARGALYQAHNLLGYARRVFSWAIDQHAYGIEASPCERIKPRAVIGEKLARNRVLSDIELKALWAATEPMGYPYGPMVKLLALTIQRKSEVAEARWSEFDLDKKLWTIPADRMKSGAAHIVPLSDQALAVLETLPRFKTGDCLFSSDFGERPVNGFSKAKARLDELMIEEMKKANSKAKVAPWVLHDIRRTGRTGLSALPIPDMVRELVIAHTKPGLHKVYDQHAYIDEKRQALDLWAARLRNIVEPPPANVVSISRATA
jgi:integrase